MSTKRKESKKLNPKNYIGNIKSKYIIGKVMDLLSEKKSLEIIKINRTLQKKLDMNITNYKNYFEKIRVVEIELTIKRTMYKFINIPEEDKQYYHIYINNIEIPVNEIYISIKKNEQIKIKIDDPVTSLKDLFKDKIYIESINFIRFNKNNITNMSHMFYNCKLLKNLNLSHFNTQNVLNMSNLFSYCESLNSLNLSKFNTSKVRDKNCMFYRCSTLKNLNISTLKSRKE